MDLLLKGKIALVTGSTAGIGLAIAKGLARENVTVIVNGRSEPRAAKAVEPFAADLSTQEGFEALKSRYPELDILVNNLGIFNPQPFEEISDDEWRRFFDVNVLSGVQSACVGDERRCAQGGWRRGSLDRLVLFFLN